VAKVDYDLGQHRLFARYFSEHSKTPADQMTSSSQTASGKNALTAQPGSAGFWDDFAFGDTWTSKTGSWIVDARASWLVKQRRAELADQRGAVESDVRTALIDLQVATDQVVLAESNRQLATQTLQQSQDRFAVGVADSVEVVNSQEALAAADHDYVNGLFSQHIAKITLAHAMGEAEKDLPELLERKMQ
jgi:hypothetical protein